MTTSRRNRELVRNAIDKIELKYRREGRFVTSRPDEFPVFLADRPPHLIASEKGAGGEGTSGEGENVAIYLVGSASEVATEGGLASIRELFADRSGWRCAMHYVGGYGETPLAVPAADAIAVRLARVEELRDPHPDAALLIAQGCLEGIARGLRGRRADEPMEPRSPADWIDQEVDLAPDELKVLHEAADMAFRLAHGDLGPEPTGAMIDVLVDAARRALALAPAIVDDGSTDDNGTDKDGDTGSGR